MDWKDIDEKNNICICEKKHNKNASQKYEKHAKRVNQMH